MSDYTPKFTSYNKLGFETYPDSFRYKESIFRMDEKINTSRAEFMNLWSNKGTFSNKKYNRFLSSIYELYAYIRPYLMRTQTKRKDDNNKRIRNEYTYLIEAMDKYPSKELCLERLKYSEKVRLAIECGNSLNKWLVDSGFKDLQIKEKDSMKDFLSDAYGLQEDEDEG